MTAEPVVRPLARARRRLFGELGSRAGRSRHGLFLLEGPKAIEDALERGVRFSYLVMTASAEPAVHRWAEAGKLNGVELHRASDAELASLADTATPQGVLAVGPLPLLALATLPARPGGLTLLVDGVQNPGNLGTLLRTLVAVGGRTALCTPGTVDPYNPKALRGAAGATFAVDIAAAVAPKEAAQWCAERGVPIIALSAGAPDLFGALLPQGQLALAVGNEAAGLSAEVVDRSALVVGLPMSGGIESLSVAVAGSVALYVLAHHLAPPRDAGSLTP